ncbi:unnamed protein product [Candida verbasci]|uniref:Beta-lactamase-related domain-containing protein n=1 Tax=Candida verbasci TaxID=1227364 RepID=A0A9W4TZZ9_9ASCO|nr:unnamed protein product [Candida verbasci]
MILPKQQENLTKSLDELLTEITTPKEDGLLAAPGCTVGVTNEKKNIYLNSKGVRNLNDPVPVKNDDTYAYFSCTKSITVMGALILYEQGKIKLDEPVSSYFPDIEKIGQLEPKSIDKKTGKFIKPLLKPKTSITVKHLITHTSGFSYGFIHPDYFTLITKGEKLDPVNPTMEFFYKKTPLVFEPGSAWMYGHSIDFLGFLIEKVAGMKLGEFLKQNIFDVIGMNKCTFHKKNFEDQVRVHYRKQDESLKLQEKFGLSLDPNLDLGGQGCFGTVGDYLKFMRVWLNYGYSPDANKRILNKSTVEFAIRNHLPDHIPLDFIGLAHNYIDEDENPDRKNDGWTLTGNAYCSNDLPTGRPQGSIYWGGFANLAYWMDFKNKIAGFYAVQVLPYMDEYNVEYIGKFETLVYDNLCDTSKL